MRIKIYKKDIWYLLISLLSFFSCFNNAFIYSKISYLSITQFVLRVIICLFLFAYIIKHNKVISVPFKLFSLMIGIFVLSALINSSDIKAAIFSFSFVITISIVIEAFRLNNHAIIVILKTWKFLLLILIIMDTITEIVYKDGLYATRVYTTNWLLGYKTERAVYSFPLIIIISYLNLKLDGKIKVRTLFVYILVLINSYLSRGTVMTVSLLIMMFAVIVADKLFRGKISFAKKAFEFFVNYKLVLSFYALITFVLITVTNNPIVSFITDYFNKDSGISGRNRIWHSILMRVSAYPVFGTGFLTTEQYVSISGFYGGSNAHNAILTLLVNGGLLAVVVYVYLHVISLRKYEGIIMTQLVIAIYANLLLGAISSILVVSTFSMLPFFLIDMEKNEMLSAKGCVNNKTD